ncbi:MAG: GHKL domain-containing protein [Lachnospiraceae bacterium]|nr:GHKL domain-containing protein [Lachnospiraceae bacterium]
MPLDLILYFIYLVLTFLFGVIFTVLFLDIPFRRKNVVWLIGYSLLSLTAQTVIGYWGSSAMVERWYPLLVHLPLLFLCVKIFRCDFTSSLSSIFLSYFLTSPRYILGYGVIICFPSLPCPEVTGRSIVTLPFALVLLRYAVTPFRQLLKRPRKDLLLFIVPLAVIYFLSYGLSVYMGLGKLNPTLLMAIMFTLLFCILFYYLQIYFVAYDKKSVLENRQRMLLLASDAIDTQVQKLQDANTQTRILRHDIRHFCTLLEGYASSGNLEKIQECLQGISEKLDKAVVKDYCRNTSVNLILSSYLEPFLREKIPTELTVNVPADIFVSETDLCMILANSLENAWNAACCAVTPFLRLELNTTSERLFFKMENACEEPVSFREDLPVTARSGHGMGTRSISLIAGKYNGIYSFSQEGKVFTTQVILHKTQSPTL